MIIAVPTDDKKGLGDTVAEHFGRCNTYTFLDEKGNVVEIIDNTSMHVGGTELPPELMKKHGTEVLLCKGIGPRAIELCKELGIDVYVSSKETVKELFDMWKDNKLKKAGFDDACDEHK